MKFRSILAGLGVLVLLGAIVAVAYFRPSSRSTNAAAETPLNTQQTPPADVTPAVSSKRGEAVPSPPVRCVPTPGHTGPIDVHEEPLPKSAAVARVAAGEQQLTRLDARAVHGDGDWIRVRYDERTGWVDGATSICRFTPAQAAQVISEEAGQVLAALKARDMAELARHVHPVKGVRFSPYVDIDARRSVVLTAAELAAAFEDGKARRWGSEDGAGEPISRSFADYYQRFVYDRDFAAAPQRRFNEFGAASTTRPNIWDVYPNAIVVEAHVPGTKPESEGMDWASLLLVFEQHDSRWYVSALVHDQWTV